MKKIISFTLLLITYCISISASNFTVQGLKYTTVGAEAYIIGYSEISSDSILDIPEIVEKSGNQYKVSKINSDAFIGCSDINKIIVPSSIKLIEANAFKNCLNLKSVIIKEGTDTLHYASDVFDGSLFTSIEIGRPIKVLRGSTSLCEGNTKLNQVIINKGITSIEDGMFYGCISLTKIELQDVTSIGGDAFYKCPITDIDLSKVIYIGQSAFELSELSDIDVSNASYIGKNAFTYCPLKSIKLCDNLTNIQAETFKGCSLLKQIELPEKLLSIDLYSFAGCSSLEEINIPQSVTYIGIGAFSSCSSLATAKLNCNVTKLEASTFENCMELKNITLPSKLETLDKNSFCQCYSLQSIDLPNSIKYIRSECFSNCKSLKNISLPNSITYLGSECFYGCKSLKSIIIPDSITLISHNTFIKCDSLEKVILPNKLNTIGNNAFLECKSLNAINFSKSIEAIGSCAFANCESLACVDGLTGITYLGKDAFKNTKWLNNNKSDLIILGKTLYLCNAKDASNISIPDSIIYITDYACSDLKANSVKLPVNLKTIGESAFNNCSNLTSILLPDSLSSIGESAFSGCSKVEVLDIPSNVKTIGEQKRMTSLQTIKFRKSDTGISIPTFPDSPIKTMTVLRSVLYQSFNRTDYTLDKLTLGEKVKSLNNSFIGIKVINLDVEDCKDTLALEGLDITKTSTLYMGRSVYFDINAKNRFSSLKTLYLGSDVTKIQPYCFCNVPLGEIDLPDELVNVGRCAFKGSGATINSINNKLSIVNDSAFYKCNITTLKCPSTLKYIGRYAFADTAIKKIYLNNDLSTICEGAFCYTKIDSISIPGTIRELKSDFESSGIFSYCDSLKYVGIEEGIRSIPYGCFSSCKNLNHVDLPQSLQYLEGTCFMWDESLKSIKLHENLCMGYASFAYTGLDSLFVPKNVEITDGCFSDTHLKYVDLTNYSESTIYHGCFSGNKYLTKVIMPKSGITLISQSAFSGCSSLSEIILPSTIDSIGENAFYKTAIKKVVLPPSFRGSDWNAFNPGDTIICFSNNVSPVAVQHLSCLESVLYILPGNNYAKYNYGGKVLEMYSLDTLDYEYKGKIISIKGHNNMPFSITPATYKNGSMTDFKDFGEYILYLNVAGTNFDGLYETNTKLNIKEGTGINDAVDCPVSMAINNGTIKFLNINQPLSISIYDMDGRLIYMKQIQSSDEISIPKGKYIIKTNSMTKKIVIE